MAITASLLITMKCSYLVVVYNSIELIWYAIRSWYPMICLLIMDGLFCHYVNDIYLRFHELNKIAMQHSKETLSVSYIDFATIDTYNKRNNLVISKIRSIQHIHHALFVLAMKVFIHCLRFMYYRSCRVARMSQNLINNYVKLFLFMFILKFSLKFFVKIIFD